MTNKEKIREAMSDVANKSCYYKQNNNDDYNILILENWIETETDKAFLVRINGGDWKMWISKKHITKKAINTYRFNVKNFNYKVFTFIKNGSSLYGDKIEKEINKEELILLFNEQGNLNTIEEVIEISDIDFFLNY